MIQFLIDRADKVQIGDIVTAATGNPCFDRDVHWIGKVMEISQPHEEITEFKVCLLAHCDETIKDEGSGTYLGIRQFGVRHEIKVGIIRGQ